MGTVHRQIASLTPEQLGNMKKIYKKYILSFVAVFLIGLIAGLSFFLVFHAKQEQAKARWDALEAEHDSYEQSGLIGMATTTSMDTLNAIDEYYNMKETKTNAFIITPAIWLVGIAIVALIFKAKYPYFNEKTYFYLKKTQNPYIK